MFFPANVLPPQANRAKKGYLTTANNSFAMHCEYFTHTTLKSIIPTYSVMNDICNLIHTMQPLHIPFNRDNAQAYNKTLIKTCTVLTKKVILTT